MVKRALTLLTSILFALPLLMPFNIFAEDDSPLLGINAQVTEIDTEYNYMTMPTINFGYAGTANTTGSITGKMACSAFSAGECATWSLQNQNGNSQAGLSITMNLANLKLTENGTWTFNKAYNYIVDYEFILNGDYKGYVVINNEKTIYVNGRSFHHSIRQSGTSEQTFTITDYELNKVTDSLLWDIPVESFTFNYYLMKDRKYEILSLNENNYWKYPIYDVPANGQLEDRFILENQYYYFIMGTDLPINNTSDLSTYFIPSSGNFSDLEIINVTAGFKFIKFKVVNMNVGAWTLKAKQNTHIIAIYSGRSDYLEKYNFTEEFNAVWDISKPIVTVNESNSKNDDLIESSNTLFSQEDGFKSNMQNAMQNVNNTFRLQDMGTKFVSSAQWVRTQYEQLTNNTPFASLITFSLITGLALILLGKVYK